MPKGNRRSRKVRYAHEVETAGRLAIASVPVFSSQVTVSEVQQRFRTTAYGYTDLVIVTDDAERYHGVVEFSRLFAADGSERLSALIRRDWPTVAPETDQEHAAERASAAGVGVLPVVTNDGRAIGVLTPAVLLDVLAREHREDMHRLVGILRERDGALHALEDPPLRRIAHRLPWLMVGLVMSAAATAVMAGFESALHANVAIAFFIPALVYLTDAIGTQTEAIAVRALSVEHRPLARLIVGETLTGGLIGAILGALAFVGVWTVFGDVRIASGVAIALLAAGLAASVLGLVLPWVLSRAGLDPAFGSGPLATIVQDVLTILIYFVVMAALLA